MYSADKDKNTDANKKYTNLLETYLTDCKSLLMQYKYMNNYYKYIYSLYIFLMIFTICILNKMYIGIPILLLLYFVSYKFRTLRIFTILFHILILIITITFVVQINELLSYTIY